MTIGEIAILSALLLVVIAIIYFFYRWALRDDG